MHKVVHDWLGKDRDDPWSLVLDEVRDGLTQRQLLSITSDKVLKVFTTKKYTLPEATGALAARQAPEPIQQLLTECKNARQEIWLLLLSQVQRGVTTREPARDNSPE